MKEKPKGNIVLGNAVVQGERVSITLSLPVVEDGATLDSQQANNEKITPDTDRATHAPDFSSVNWFGIVYTFTPKQRSVIADLWQAWQDGYDAIGQDALLHEAESDCSRLRDLFLGNPAWGTMVVQAKFRGGRAGQYCLNVPSNA